MKTRIIDKKSVSSYRQPSDDVWRVYANHLITAFGDALIQNGLPNDISESLYCEQRVRELDNEVLESLIYTLPPAFINKEKKENFSKNIHWGSSKNSPFILLGHVGSGKSTFLDHNLLYKFPNKYPNFQAIIINFLESQDNHDNFVRYLCIKINEELNAIYSELSENGYKLIEKLFAKEIGDYKSTFSNQNIIDDKINSLCADYIDCHLPGKELYLQEFIKRKISYIKHTKKIDLWIVLDNIDQHHTCLQNSALVAAVSLATNFQCYVVISMRYITLTTPAAKNIYQSYRPRKLKLSFPLPTELLEKRVAYFKKIASDLSSESLEWTGNTLTVKDLVRDIESTIKLLTDPKFLDECVLPLSNFNLRRMLEIILSVFQSYFFFYDRFNNNRYPPNKSILYKRFLQAHLLKNEDYYGINRDHQESFIINIFENNNKSYAFNQTIRIRLLQGILSSGDTTTFRELTSLILSTFDYSKYELLRAYRTFLKNELFAIKGDLNINLSDKIFHDGFSEEHMEQDLQISLTHAGRYHYEIFSMIEYIEIMKYSTFIDDEIYLDIQSESNNKTIRLREISTNKFVDYIQREEMKEIENAILDHHKFETYFGIISPILKKGVKFGYETIAKYSEYSLNKTIAR